MVYLPTPFSPALQPEGGPSEPVLVPPRLNRQSLVQSHHDDPDLVANQIALATDQNQNQIQQSLQSDSSPRTSHESIKPVTQLPAEILDEIFSYVKAPTLARVALVCHMFQGVATRLLYRHVPSLSISLTTRCLETLASSPSLAAYTRSFEIGDVDFADASRKGLLPPPFFNLLQRALHNMHRLTELTFYLNGPTSHVLLGAPFKLTKLVASCDFDATFTSWLPEQSSLSTAIFCGNYTTGVTLPADAIPSLRRVAAAPLTLACVVPGRAIREVDLCLVHPWSLNREVLQMAIRTIASSKGPLDSLRIITHLAESPETVLSAFAVIPTGLNSITKLALHAVSGSINDVRLVSLRTSFRVCLPSWHSFLTSNPSRFSPRTNPTLYKPPPVRAR
ncbi:hypothetical protein F5888DRAFT_1685881 [Russula emetica]|nr:hypothetical protein F5888DRAFT_1685881 [Russula emetica]